MAGFVRKKDSQPLLTHLERPSRESAQTTAHVINACFKEAAQLGSSSSSSSASTSMAVSRREEPRYHDEYVAKLKEVSEEYGARLEELAALERHLVQARARALAEDEKALVVLAEKCSGYSDITVPKGPSHLHKHLDDDLVSRHSLLVPASYLPPPSVSHQPPQGGAPTYLQSTHTSVQHARAAPPPPFPSSSSSSPPSSSQPLHRPSKPVWKDTLTPSEREAEKAALAKLEQKAHYLRNPKYSSGLLTNTASSGPLKLSKPAASEDKPVQFFIAEPPEIVFTDYQIGRSYEATVELKNISGASRQLRIVPLDTPHFSVRTGYFPNAEGLIAPGMHCSYTVTFTPDSLANYQDQLKVCTDIATSHVQVLSHCGDGLVVPLKGVRPAPELSLAGVLECGHCLTGSTKAVEFPCTNSGGEGSFMVLADAAASSEDTAGDNTAPSEQSLHVGCFTVSPLSLNLTPGSCDHLRVLFAPPPGRTGEFSASFSLACDNGQVHAFTLAGSAEMVSVGCLCAAPSSSNEVAAFQAGPAHSVFNGEAPVITDQVVSHDQALPSPVCLHFDPVNPGSASYRTVTVRNFSNVDLPYHWKLYRPISQFPDTSGLPGRPLRDEDAPLISSLIASDNTVFAVQPREGVMPAASTVTFVMQFQPSETGVFVDMAHLVLPDLPPDCLEPGLEETAWLRLSDTEVALVCVELNGQAQPYSVELYPPALILPGSLPIATEVAKRLKVTNGSLCTVHYAWSCFEDDTVKVTVEPPEGSIVGGGSVYCEVLAAGSSEGSFSTQLLCSIRACDYAAHLTVQGHIQGPVVSFSAPSLNFGLIQLGKSASLKLVVANESNCTVHYLLQQLEGQWLSVEPGSSGRLQAHSSTTVAVQCAPPTTGSLRSALQTVINGAPYRLIEVCAEVQRPEVYLERCRLHCERAYVGVAEGLSVTLTNSSLLPTHFTWSSQLVGASAGECSVHVSPSAGRVGPRQSVSVSITTTWNKTGSQSEAVLQCFVLGMEEPLSLQLSAEVYGLSVLYHVTQAPGSSDVCADDQVLDFGRANELGVPSSLTLTITNTSAIATSISAHVISLPAAKPPTPPDLPTPDKKSAARGKKFLLSRSAAAGAGSKSEHKAATELSSAFLRGGHGVCFVVDPPSTTLPPFTTSTLTLTAHCNMWGHYQDKLVCQVGDLQHRVFPISYEARGCPIVFQTTASSAYTLLRFGSHTPSSKLIKRQLRLKNTSPIAIRVDWKMFNVLLKDDKILDFIAYIGEPFPRQPTNSLVKACMRHSDSLDKEGNSALSLSSEGGECEGGEGGEGGEGRIVRVLLKPHEGVLCFEPFDIHPKQMVIPANGLASVHVTFHPTTECLKDVGENITSYALGYCSLDGAESVPGVSRLSGYDVQPLRIDITATIEHTKLQLECDDDDEGLDFTYPASLLFHDQKVLDFASRTHHFTLLNPGSSTQQFTLSLTSPHFTIVPSDSGVPDLSSALTLKPYQSIHFSVSFTYCLEDVRLACSEGREVVFSDALTVEFSTGVTQEFPFTAKVLTPCLRLGKDTIDFATCLLESCHSAVVTLTNPTISAAKWSLLNQTELSAEGVVSVSPSSGLLAPHLTNGKLSSELVQVTFKPSQELDYSTELLFSELLTGQQVCVTVRGNGSSDEKHSKRIS